MRLGAIVAVAVVGVAATALAAARLWRASKRGAPRELQLGYLGLMLAAGAVSLLVLRAL